MIIRQLCCPSGSGIALAIVVEGSSLLHRLSRSFSTCTFIMMKQPIWMYPCSKDEAACSWLPYKTKWGEGGRELRHAWRWVCRQEEAVWARDKEVPVLWYELRFFHHQRGSGLCSSKNSNSTRSNAQGNYTQHVINRRFKNIPAFIRTHFSYSFFSDMSSVIACGRGKLVFRLKYFANIMSRLTVNAKLGCAN